MLSSDFSLKIKNTVKARYFKSMSFFEGIVSSTVIRLGYTKPSWKIRGLYSRPNTAVGDRLTLAVAKPFTLRQPIKTLA